jgi:hypothetical protein
MCHRQGSARSSEILCLGLCKKPFAAYGSRIFFRETLHFHNFAKRNCENEVSLKALFGASRQIQV